MQNDTKTRLKQSYGKLGIRQVHVYKRGTIKKSKKSYYAFFIPRLLREM